MTLRTARPLVAIIALLGLLQACDDSGAAETAVNESGNLPTDANGDFADTVADIEVPQDDAPPDSAEPDLPPDAPDAVDAADTGNTADAAYPPNDVPSDVGRALQSLLDENLPDAVAPGASMRVVIPGVGAWAGATGLAQLEPETPVVPADRFRVGSITKTFVSAAILLLVDQGVVQLDDHLVDWVDGFEVDADVTLEMLLNHTSGVFNFTDDTGFLSLAAEESAPEAVIDWALGHGDEFAPGTSWKYSNTNYFLLGLVIEEATGDPLHVTLRDLLLDPRALEDTFLQPQELVQGGMVDGHSAGIESTDVLHASWAWAAGGMVSSGYDLCDWAADLFAGDVLPPALRDRMLEPATYGDGVPASYGLGVAFSSRGGHSVIGHTGGTNGFDAEMFYHPETGVCVTILTNDFFGRSPEIGNPVWRYVMDLVDR